MSSAMNPPAPSGGEADVPSARALPGPAGCNCQEETTFGHQETWQLRDHFWWVHDL